MLELIRNLEAARAHHSRYAYLLGLVSDSVLAQLTGVSRARIWDMRKAMETGGKAFR